MPFVNHRIPHFFMVDYKSLLIIFIISARALSTDLGEKGLWYVQNSVSPLRDTLWDEYWPTTVQYFVEESISNLVGVMASYPNEDLSDYGKITYNVAGALDSHFKRCGFFVALILQLKFVAFSTAYEQ